MSRYAVAGCVDAVQHNIAVPSMKNIKQRYINIHLPGPQAYVYSTQPIQEIQKITSENIIPPFAKLFSSIPSTIPAVCG